MAARRVAASDMARAIESAMAKAKWPDRWLMTDERMGDGLFPALEGVPTGGGVVFRHHDDPDRTKLAQEVAGIARARGLLMCVSHDVGLARNVGAQLVHNPASPTGDLPLSLAVHTLIQADEANSRSAALAFVSPLFSTRSHPGSLPLSRDEAARIVAQLDCPAIALGGVDAQNYATIESLGFSGWAGIDAWLRT